MKNLNYPSSIKEHIEKKDVSAYFYDKEDMEKVLEYKGNMCGGGYFRYRRDNYRGINCGYIDCDDCPFFDKNKELLKSMLPQLNELKEEIKMPIRIHKEPIVGELAIFWDYNKIDAHISIFKGIEQRHGYYTGSLNFAWKNAILFESAEQYKNFIKEPND